MESSKDILGKVEEAKTIIAEMILSAKSQRAKNFDMLYVLQNALEELGIIMKNEQKVNSNFLKKWDSIMGWAPKVFEDHPLLDLLRDIDKVIIEGDS